MQTEIQDVSSDFQVLLGKMEATQNSHGAALIEMEDLYAKFNVLESIVKEQDAILQDLALQISF